MPKVVIASSASLLRRIFAPWSTKPLPVHSVRKAASAFGLRVPTEVGKLSEFTAAKGLSSNKALALAASLEDAGFHVQVCEDETAWGHGSPPCARIWRAPAAPSKRLTRPRDRLPTMSTTVIASGAGLSLYLAPWASGEVDIDAVNRVLLRHGLQTRGSEQPGVEFIAAEGLSDAQARELASDLQAIGLTVRVKRRVGLERSARVGQALYFNLALIMMLVGMGIPVAIETGFHPGLLAMALPALYMMFNVAALARRGGNTLALASKPAQDQGQVSQALLEMRDELPDALFARLLTRAQALEAKVATHPNGQAAQELEELARSLKDQQDEQVAEEVSELKDDLDQARRAIREAKRQR